MGECSYWWKADDDEQRCDLTDRACACAGRENNCPLGGRAIGAALREEEKVTLAETAMRARRARKAKEAS